MVFPGCKPDGCQIPEAALIGVAAAVLVMLLTILVLSICLCHVCKKIKKRKLTEDMNEGRTEELDLHYAELQILPVSGRGQCDGGTCAGAEPAAAQSSDYATVAELRAAEEDCCDDGGDYGEKEKHLSMGMD